jgi:hypothetical protein
MLYCELCMLRAVRLSRDGSRGRRLPATAVTPIETGMVCAAYAPGHSQDNPHERGDAPSLEPPSLPKLPDGTWEGERPREPCLLYHANQIWARGDARSHRLDSSNPLQAANHPCQSVHSAVYKGCTRDAQGVYNGLEHVHPLYIPCTPLVHDVGQMGNSVGWGWRGGRRWSCCCGRKLSFFRGLRWWVAEMGLLEGAGRRWGAWRHAALLRLNAVIAATSTAQGGKADAPYFSCSR